MDSGDPHLRCSAALFPSSESGARLSAYGEGIVNIRRPLLVIAVIAAFQMLSAMPGFAKEKTKIDLVNDCGESDPASACDNAGTTAGFVKFEQDDTGGLNIDVMLHGARPETSYRVFLTCGPTIAQSCGFIQIGTVITNAAGIGRSDDMVVPVATLQAKPFGSGQRADEITIVREVGDRSAGAFDQVTPFTYTVP